MGTTLHAILQRQVGPEKDDAWMTFATEDFGKDYDLQIALGRAKEDEARRPPPRGVDTVRLLDHVDSIGGHTVQIFTEKEFRSALMASILPSSTRNVHVRTLLDHLERTRARGWAVRIVFWCC